ncbi:hypothetical protein V4C53_04980 [Paraburkholderia azotifigens]|uniref:hypothetical protein n=1 Tax=Paraburkholderia azotifigens TaxID=2057004 RepID=UPI0031701D48
MAIKGAAGTGFDIAEMVAFLVSDRARHMTGTPAWIDGGQSLLVGEPVSSFTFEQRKNRGMRIATQRSSGHAEAP